MQVWLQVSPATVIVVAHERPGVHPEARALATLSKHTDKSPPILVVPDNELSPFPARHDVIYGPGKHDSHLTCHYV